MSTRAIPYGPAELLRSHGVMESGSFAFALALAAHSPQLFVHLGSGYLVKRIEKLAVSTAELVVTLEGLSARVSNSPQRSFLDSDDELGGMLIELEASLRDTGKSASRAAVHLSRAPVGGRRYKVRAALKNLADSAAAAAAAARDFRGLVDSHDANVAAIKAAQQRAAHQPQVATSLEDLKRQLEPTSAS